MEHRSQGKHSAFLPWPRYSAIFILGLLASQPEAHAQQAIMSQGDLVVTGFSGVVAVPTTPGGDPADGTFIDPAGSVMRILDVSSPGLPPQGQVLNAPAGFQVKAGVTGQVFGIAIDDGKGPDGTASGSPAKVITLRWWSASEWTSSRRASNAPAIASIAPGWQPSETLGIARRVLAT